MSAKDYKILAAALKESKPDVHQPEYPALLQQWRYTVLRVADALSANNFRFNKRLFYEACSYELPEW